MPRYGTQFGPDITFLGVPRCTLDEPETWADAQVVILGAPFDGGTSYRAGARFGPKAMRETDNNPHDGSRPSMAMRTDGLVDLAVMDAAAISLCRENKLPIIVFNIHEPGAFTAVMKGEGKFTTVVEH